MACNLISTKCNYQGSSTDSKPTVVTDAPVGSEFYEYDTGKTYQSSTSGWNQRLDSIKLTNSTTFSVGIATCTTEGTAVAIGSCTAIPDGCVLVITPATSNLGIAYIGPSSSQAQARTFALTTGEYLKLAISKPSLVWVAGSTSAISIKYIVEGSA